MVSLILSGLITLISFFVLKKHWTSSKAMCTSVVLAAGSMWGAVLGEPFVSVACIGVFLWSSYSTEFKQAVQDIKDEYDQ